MLIFNMPIILKTFLLAPERYKENNIGRKGVLQAIIRHGRGIGNAPRENRLGKQLTSDF